MLTAPKLIHCIPLYPLEQRGATAAPIGVLAWESPIAAGNYTIYLTPAFKRTLDPAHIKAPLETFIMTRGLAALETGQAFIFPDHPDFNIRLGTAVDLPADSPIQAAEKRFWNFLSANIITYGTPTPCAPTPRSIPQGQQLN